MDLWHPQPSLPLSESPVVQTASGSWLVWSGSLEEEFSLGLLRPKALVSSGVELELELGAEPVRVQEPLLQLPPSSQPSQLVAAWPLQGTRLQRVVQAEH